jgi:hypothetical protein
MAVIDEEARVERRRRAAAVVGASLVAGAFEAAHSLAYGGVQVSCVVVTVLSALLELTALTAALELGLRRRMSSGVCFTLSFALALAVGAGEAFVDWGVQARFGIICLGGPRHWNAANVTELGLSNGVLGFGLWAMAVVLPFAVRDANARSREAERLRATAELAQLRAHLQPHFLLNTLNTVAGLVGEHPREARNLIGALGDLLRDSLEETDEMQTLEDEVAWLKRYAGILETRHKGAITFRWDVDEAARRLRVPRLLLQPLLENAVKHGALRRRDGGEVAVRASVDAGEGGAGAGRLRCVIEDNGPGPGGRAARPGALGIQLVTRRLAVKYAGAAAFRLEASDGRTRSIVELPAEASP